jgi:F0F1-type ATP synthase assembly protein I
MKQQWPKYSNDWARYSGAALQMLATIALGIWIGKQLDNNSEKPLYTVLGALAGVALGIGAVIKSALKSNGKK